MKSLDSADKWNDAEIEAMILYKLARKKIWGPNTYKPYESVVNWITGKVGDAKRVRMIADDMEKEGLLLYKKRGEVMTLNIERKGEIIKIIEDILDKNISGFSGSKTP